MRFVSERWDGGRAPLCAQGRSAFIISPLIYFTTRLIKNRPRPRYIRRCGAAGREKLKRFLVDPRTRIEQRAPPHVPPPPARPAVLFCIILGRADVNRTCFSLPSFSFYVAMLIIRVLRRDGEGGAGKFQAVLSLSLSLLRLPPRTSFHACLCDGS